jgi:hypothetical protein
MHLYLKILKNKAKKYEYNLKFFDVLNKAYCRATTLLKGEIFTFFVYPGFFPYIRASFNEVHSAST